MRRASTVGARLMRADSPSAARRSPITVGRARGHRARACAMLALRHASVPFAARLVVVGDRELCERAQRIGLVAALRRLRPRRVRAGRAASSRSGTTRWRRRVLAGQPDPTNAHSVLRMLQTRADACATGAFAAMVTAPDAEERDDGRRHSVHGPHRISWPQRTHTPRVVMMLVGGARDGAAARGARHHAPAAWRRFPRALTKRAVVETLAIVARALRESSASPRRASPCAASIRMPAKAAISAARRSTSSRRRWRRPRATGRDSLPGRSPPTPCSCPSIARAYDADRRDVSRPGTAGAQGGELRLRRERDARACRFRARRSITARRSTLRSTPSARRPRIPEASSPRSISRSGLRSARNAGA